MKTTRTLLAGAGALALSLAAAPSAFAAESYQIQLDSLNDSGATGNAVLTLDGNDLTVEIEAQGLVPNQPHAQHIHGDTDLSQDYFCPGPERDTDGDGIVSTVEGLPDYGDVFISLTTEGDTSADSGLAVDRMPVADADGNVSYERTIEVDDATIEAITNLHVVQHGIDVNDNGEYDAEAGPSTLDPSLPLEATAPANCGMVAGANIENMPEGGVDTGQGDPAALQSTGVMALGGASLAAAAGGLVLLRRRTVTQEH